MTPAFVAPYPAPARSGQMASRKTLVEPLGTWESIVSRSPNAICMTDEHGTLEYVNAAFERLFGYAATDILGRHLCLLDASNTIDNCPAGTPPSVTSSSSAHPSGTQSGQGFALPGLDHRISLQQTRATGSWQAEVAARHCEGHQIPVRVNTLPRSTSSSQSRGFVSVFADISENKRRAYQLEILHSFAEGLSSTLDLNTIVEHGLSAVIGLTETDFAALAFPNDDGATLSYRWTTPPTEPALLAAFATTTSMAGAVLRSGQDQRLPDRTALGKLSDPLVLIGAQAALACPVFIQGQARAVLCVASLVKPCQMTPERAQLLAIIARQIGVALDRDQLMNEARASNRQLDEIIHRNPDAILITDDSGCVRFTNPAAQRLLARDEPSLKGFPLGLTSQNDSGEIDVRRPGGDLVPVELHAMETTWEGLRAHVLTLRDLSDRRLAEQEKRVSAERIRTALVQTIEAISRTVETRDPYTACHQRRVAALSREIALAMGLEPAIVDGIYMGGTIHDIGKLYIPAEILNRPGKLNETEFMLIKTHCAVGRDIIGGIDFPWPLANMVHQHHERIDGSGYPQGLRGEDIMLEARILSVADVVDAMSSRRPYREALGLDAALAEIKRGSGTHYDPEIVAICNYLFTEKHLRIEDLEVIQK